MTADRLAPLRALVERWKADADELEAAGSLTAAQIQRDKANQLAAALRAVELARLENDDAVRGVVERLLACLPDAIHDEQCWKLAWDELDGEAQDAVQRARIHANAFLETLRVGAVEAAQPEQEPDRDALVWAVAIAHAEHAIAALSAAGRSSDYAHGLADAADAIRDLPVASDLGAVEAAEEKEQK